MNASRLREKLASGEPTLGAFLFLDSVSVCELMAQLDFDWILVDEEHSTTDIGTAQAMLQAMQGTQVTPLIRVDWNDPVVVKKVLDIGYQGVMIPYVLNRQDAENAVRYCKYPPRGSRGVGPLRASRYFLDFADYMARADNELLTIIQIEHVEAIRHIDEILSVPGIDVGFIGPNDLCASMGLMMQYDHPDVVAAIDTAVTAMKRAEVVPGIMPMNLDLVEPYIEQGFRMLVVATDFGCLLDGARNVLGRFGRKG